MTQDLDEDIIDVEDDAEADEGLEGDRGWLLIVTIHDEDSGGRPYKFRARPRALVQRVIDRFYRRLGSDHQDGDRLYCLGSGQDVFAHGQEPLSHFQEHSCPDLEWGFSRPTGGA